MTKYQLLHPAWAEGTSGPAPDLGSQMCERHQLRLWRRARRLHYLRPTAPPGRKTLRSPTAHSGLSALAWLGRKTDGGEGVQLRQAYGNLETKRRECFNAHSAQILLSRSTIGPAMKSRCICRSRNGSVLPLGECEIYQTVEPS
jgi:hypothetical protein